MTIITGTGLKKLAVSAVVPFRIVELEIAVDGLVTVVVAPVAHQFKLLLDEDNFKKHLHILVRKSL